MRETELRFSAHASFMIPALEHKKLAGLDLEERPVLDLRATYYDTQDLRLARSGVTLRFRTGDSSGGAWTLKLAAADDANTREELVFEAPAGVIPERARSLVTAYARRAPLMPVARLWTRRRPYAVVRDGEQVAEIDDDEVSIVEGRRVVARFREIEVESKGIDAAALARIGDVIASAGAVPAEPIPKAVRALGPRATAPPDVQLPPRLEPSDPAATAVRAAFAAAVTRVIENDAFTRLGEHEAIHQMRVGARRLRSDLRTFAPLLHDDWAGALSAEVKWLARVLGDVRELDVMQARIRRLAPQLGDALAPFFAKLVEDHERATDHLRDALGSERYAVLLERLVDAANDPALSELAAESSVVALPPLVRAAWEHLARPAAKLKVSSPDDGFHDVRIRAKRARYAAEAVARALGSDGKKAARFASAAAELQDALGTHQDAVVANEALLAFAATHPDDGPLNLGIGRAIEIQAREAAMMKERFFELWKKFDRKKNVDWF